MECIEMIIIGDEYVGKSSLFKLLSKDKSN